MIFQISRLFIITSIISHSLALLTGTFGLTCISIGGHRPDFKYRLVRRNNELMSILEMIRFQNILSIMFHIIDLLSELACTLSFTIPLLQDYYKPSQKVRWKIAVVNLRVVISRFNSEGLFCLASKLVFVFPGRFFLHCFYQYRYAVSRLNKKQLYFSPHVPDHSRIG